MYLACQKITYIFNTLWLKISGHCDKKTLPAEKVLFCISATANLERETMKLPSITAWIDKEI